MNKIPNTQYPILEVLKNRWSARAFTNQAVTEETMQQLFEATSWAASSMNEQPWRYIYALRGTPAFDTMVDCLMAGNQPWAKNAAALVLSIAHTTFARDGKPNRHAYYDVGAANTTFSLEALHLDLYIHQMGGFEYAKTVETFNLPAGQEPVVFIALGYLDTPESLPEPYKNRETTPRTRKTLSEFVSKL